MSDRNNGGPGGKEGFGPKKPRGATFGDVMLGIPSGRSDEKGGGRDGGGGKRPERPERGPRPERQEGAPPAEAPKPEGAAQEQRGPRRERGGRDKGPRQERKPQGPLVVVKRASGQVETRALEPASGAATPAPEAARSSESRPGRAGRRAGPRPPTPTPTPARSSALFEEVPEAETFAEMFEASAKHGRRAGRSTCASARR